MLPGNYFNRFLALIVQLQGSADLSMAAKENRPGAKLKGGYCVALDRDQPVILPICDQFMSAEVASYFYMGLIFGLGLLE